jgi:hypothetical protein
MDLGMLKTQIMTMFMVRSATPGKPGEPHAGNNDILMILYSMMMINLIEWIFRQLPAATEYAKAYLTERFGKKKNAWQPLLDAHQKSKETINSVTMTRLFKEGEKPADRIDNIVVEKIDAVLDYICALDSARHVRMDVRFSLNSADEIDIMPLLKAKIKQNGGANDSSTELILYSTVLKVSDIRAWIDEVHANYVAEKNNKLGNKIFYFNEIVYEPTVMADMSGKDGPKQVYRWDNMPKMLTFNMNEFKTSKSFGNVYGHHVDELKERLDLFVNHPDWYMDRGIPYSLGIMLHGVPGAGKTSTIKAIAKDTNRHIFNLSLRPYTTQRQLTNLFFNETVHVQTYDGGKQTLKIPLNKRVYVIEDIDCLTDVVLDRALTKEPLAANKEGEAVTLSFLLNLLDGVLETPGRILVITSNYPDKLDKAFVRPGRIDVRIEFKYADREFILDMLNKFYTTKMDLSDVPAEIVDAFTPAEVMESMCNNFKSPSGALSYLTKKLAAKKAKEEEMASGTRLEDLGLEVETAAPVILTAAEAPDAIVGDETTRADTPIPSTDPPTLIVTEDEVPPAVAPPAEPKEEPKKQQPVPQAPISSKQCCTMCNNWYDRNTPGAQAEHEFAICLREPPKLLTSPQEFVLRKEGPREWRSYGISWNCPYDHQEYDSKHCKICKPKRAEAESRQLFEMQRIQQAGLMGPSDDNWGAASFMDAVIPEGAGGWMPGQPREGEQRSQVDLNTAAGR